MIYLTADLHFYHKRMAEVWRDYASVEEMNEDLVTQWNDEIGPKDEVYVLGDFSFGSLNNNRHIFGLLNGRKYLIKGNHDHGSVTRLPWAGMWDFRRVKHEGISVYCFHYPMLTWPNAHRGTVHAHGHAHGNLQASPSTRMDVGIDATGVIALPIEKVIEECLSRPYDFVDHHEPGRGDEDGY